MVMTLCDIAAKIVKIQKFKKITKNPFSKKQDQIIKVLNISQHLLDDS
jgi:hypothetical protein